MHNCAQKINFSELIKNKRCIVLAPSGYLKGKGEASRDFIDSFDLVVKTTNMCELEDPQQELGSRCDIWYGLVQNSHGWKLDLTALLAQQVQHMRVQPCLPSYKKTWQKYMTPFEQEVKNFPLSWSIANADSYQKLADLFNCIPFSGVFAICDLLNSGARQVYAYGHDFYRTGYFTDATTLLAVDNVWHQVQPQINYLSKLLKTEPRFDCDDNLKGIIAESNAASKSQHDNEAFLRSELSKVNLQGQSVMFRSNNIKLFSSMLKVMSQLTDEQNLTVVCQPSVTEVVSQFPVKIIPYSNESKFICNKLKQELQLLDQDINQVILPYNGRPLLEYIDLIEFALHLKAKKIIFISPRGAIKIYQNVNELFNRLNWYVQQKDRIQSAITEFDRKDCL